MVKETLMPPTRHHKDHQLYSAALNARQFLLLYQLLPTVWSTRQANRSRLLFNNVYIQLVL